MYQLTISKKQAEVISRACDVYARLLMGQMDEAFQCMPLKKDVDYMRFREIQRSLQEMLPEVLIHEIDGFASSLGVSSLDLDVNSNIAVDIHQVIRYSLSMEEALEKGIISSKEERKWPEMMTVNFDKPHKWSDEKLAVIERIEK